MTFPFNSKHIVSEHIISNQNISYQNICFQFITCYTRTCWFHVISCHTSSSSSSPSSSSSSPPPSTSSWSAAKAAASSASRTRSSHYFSGSFLFPITPFISIPSVLIISPWVEPPTPGSFSGSPLFDAKSLSSLSQGTWKLRPSWMLKRTWKNCRWWPFSTKPSCLGWTLCAWKIHSNLKIPIRQFSAEIRQFDAICWILF